MAGTDNAEVTDSTNLSGGGYAGMQPGRTLRVLVTGGGTGGHTTPAVATVEAIRAMARQGDWTVSFTYLGGNTGVERKTAADLGVPFVGIETGKLRRSRSMLGLISLANLRDAVRVPVGYAQAIRAVRRARPDVVLSTGGYVSVPGVLAAGALAIPVVAHEQTVQVGLANRINFRVAQVIAVSVDETLSALPAALQARVVVIGNPVRSVIFDGTADRAAGRFGFDATESSLPTVYVTGGAQGSHLINQAVEDALGQLVQFCRIIHQCGIQAPGAEQDLDRLTAARSNLREVYQTRYAVTQVVGAEIGDVYALADLIVGRSGAGTVAELCELGKPALFVPLVPTGGDEQTKNAVRVANAGGAVIVRQDELTGESLLRAIEPMLADRARLAAMGERARSLSRPGAAIRLAELVVKTGASRACSR